VLDLSDVDLDLLATALEDHSPFGSSWWIDARTGEVWMWSDDMDPDPAWDPEERDDARGIPPLESRIAYGDMADFVAIVPNRDAAELLDRAITGRGAFRRFKDTLSEFPKLRQQWFTFRDTRMRRRAIEFLVDERLVDDEVAARTLAGFATLPFDDGVSLDARSVAVAVAADLRVLYGDRLVEVVLYGSQARGDAHPDSDVDLAVVLDRMTSPWDELRRMDDVLWRHTKESGVTISATPVGRQAWDEGTRPLVRSAKAEGQTLA
jgi:hypothetical protein